MDALTLGTFLIPILTVTTVWNTGETGDTNTPCKLPIVVLESVLNNFCFL